MKTIYLVANWKSNKTVEEARSWLSDFSCELREFKTPLPLTVILSVPFTVSAVLQEEIKKLEMPIHLGVQNVSQFQSGAYTGEISAQMLEGLAEYVIIGHSERRKYLNETDEMLLKKVEQAKLSGLKIIYCVENDLMPIPDGVDIIVYESFAVIGSGKPEDPASADLMCRALKEKNGGKPVLYGGSVNKETMKEFCDQPSIDGVIVGGASLKPDQFMQLILAFASYG